MENIPKNNQTHPFNVGEPLVDNRQNPLKGGFLVGSHLSRWKLYFKNKIQND
jgi:hypothetical protein